jgi:osmotically-inducible protein OsmY
MRNASDPEPDLMELPAHHVEPHLSQAISEDPRCNELDIRVRVYDRTVSLEGEVATPGRREEVEQVVSELAPGWAIANRIEVAQYAAPTEEETIP